jgi:hypothetical protein
MMTLARGKSGVLTAQAIRELLIAMQGTHHNTFDDAVDVKDIADLLRINIWWNRELDKLKFNKQNKENLNDELK